MSKANLIFTADGNGRFLLTGEITHQTVLSVIDAAIVPVESRVLVDFSGVTRSDSAGLALMVHWVRRVKKMNASISYEQVPEKLLALAKMSGLDVILSMTAADDLIVS